MVTILFNGHQIEVENTRTAEEIVRYDGKVVSKKRTFTGGSHFFQALEEGKRANYEVTFNLVPFQGVGIVVRRNGLIIFSSDRRIKPPMQITPLVYTSGSRSVIAATEEGIVQIKCPYCNHRNSSDLSFCEKCGASI